MMATNSIAPRAVARFAPRVVMTSGMVVAAVGLVGLAAVVTARGDGLGLVVPSVVTGLGFGLAFIAGVIAATAPAPTQHAGVASGLVNTSQQVGGALGLAALLSLVVALAGASSPTAGDFATALLAAASVALVAAGVAALGLPGPTTRGTVPTIASRREAARASLGRR
jgi:sugar phosphate permease